VAAAAARLTVPTSDVSCLTLNRLSVYLRCLRELQGASVLRISSLELASRFDLSAAQIRKDLAQFGEFGIRGVGYDVDHLVERLRSLLGLDRAHNLVVIGMGQLGTAVARHFATNHRSFRVVGAFDIDEARVGSAVGPLTVLHVRDMPVIVRRHGAEIGVLAVPAAAAQESYDLLVAAGVRSVLNFAPVQLRRVPQVRTRTVDLRIYLEELVYFLACEPAVPPAGLESS
jgi:redox-sensing transcriptional repressor